jgi:hypothetical protein
LSFVDRTFRLSQDANNLGLNCTPDGCTLAGVPLLQRTTAGFTPRPAREISALMKSAYGRDIDPRSLLPGLDVVARALNQGDVARGMVAALRLKLPDVSWCGAAQLTKAYYTLEKYNPDEPRDERGRWTTGDDAESSATLKPIPVASRSIPNDFDDVCMDAGRNCVINSIGAGPNGSTDSKMWSACQEAQTTCHVVLISSRLSPETQFLVILPDKTIVGIEDGVSDFRYINGIRIPRYR